MPGTVTGVKSADGTGSYRQLRGKGFAVHQLLVTRMGSGEVVPNIVLMPDGLDAQGAGRPMVIWTHPDGKRSLFDADGITPVPAARWLLQHHVPILAPDVFLTGEFQPQDADSARTARPRIKDQEKFAGYNDGYNRTVLANRVRDLLTVVAFAQQLQPAAIHLVAFDRAGTWALLARALAGDAIARASIDLGGFDFTQVREPDDEMMLPGGLKYGGILGFAPLFATNPGATELYRAPAATAPWLTAGSPSRAALLGSRTVIRHTAPRADQMIRWVLQQ
jgi:hypothetical protein